MSYEEFRKRIDTARQILVGAVPSPAGQIDQITYALMYKFMNDIDDQSAALGGKRIYFAGNYAKYNWHELMKPGLEAHEQLELYRQAIQGMSKNPGLPPLFREIYQNAFLPFNSPSVLHLFLGEINKFDHGDSDDIGDAYEYLLSITGAQGDVGQFRTPRHIIKFIVEAVSPTKDDTILDPAVGTAGFLIAAYNHVKSQHDGKDDQGNANDEKRLTADELEKLHHNYRGFDIDPTMVRTASVNLYLHGFTSHNTIINHDSLSSEDYWKDKYDVILANPPFMTPKGGIQPHKKFSISANRAEVLFVDYIASHLKPNGRAGVIVPEGVIFQSGKAYKDLRKNLVENYLYAVVSLPAGVFQPYSGVKTSVLLMDKQLAKERDDILFVKVENDGYTLGSQRRRDVLNDQLPQSLDFIKLYQKNYHQDTQYSYVVSRKIIAESGDYSLSGDRYKINDVSTSDWPTVELGNKDYFSIESGGTPDSKNERYWGGDINWVTLADIPASRRITEVQSTERKITEAGLSNSSAKLLPADTILISSRATIGRVGLARLPLATNQGFKNIIVNDTKVVLPEFVVHLMSSDHMTSTLKSLATGGTFPEFSKTALSGVKIPLPPLEIQREIVAELDDYQKIIDAARTVVKTYKPLLRADQGWPKIKLGELFELEAGVSVNSENRPKSKQEKGILKTSAVTYGTFIPTENKVILHAELERAKVTPKKDNIIISRMNTLALVGASAYVEESHDDLYLPDRLWQTVRLRDDFSMKLVFYAISSPEYRKTISDVSSGTSGSMKNISKKAFLGIQIPLPPLEIQREIVAELEAEQKLIDANKKLIEIHQQKIKSKLAEIWGE